LVELFEGSEFVGGQFEGVEGAGIDAQVLKFIATEFVLAKFQARQVLVGGEVLQSAKASLVKSKGFQAGESGEESFIFCG
jgi:hypothetical protein